MPVAPLAGARIEIAEQASQVIKDDVAPLAGARIEIHSNGFLYTATPSLPSRERGLKYDFKNNDNVGIDVAPLAGARIEILIRSTAENGHCVAPLAGARIEIVCQQKR